MTTDALYHEAAAIVGRVRASKGTVRNLCYNSRYANKKCLFGLVTETLKHFEILRIVVEKSGLLGQERGLKSELALVLLHDYLYREELRCKPELATRITKHKARLRAEWVKAKLKIGEVKEVEPERRFIRLNRCLAQEIGHEIASACEADEHIADLFSVPAVGLDITKTESYKTGRIIIQDKASCMPAFVLAPPPGSVVVDACAAPGNKTSHLAALMGNKGHIFAFERDGRRFETLKQLTTKAGCTIINPRHADFLSINPQAPEYAQVEYALVDPSCSGSGILKSHEKTGEAVDRDRLKSLANFQAKIIKHALQFPRLKRLVYSTCSIHEEENEAVVKEILESVPNVKLVESPLPSWPRRGLGHYAFAQHVIRADPISDGTHGFFVALFQKN